MKLGDLIAEARRRLDDSAAPQLWTDAFLTLAANEAQREACERSWLLYDKTTSALCQIALVEGQSEYPLDPRVIDVDMAKLQGARLPLERITEHQYDRELPVPIVQRPPKAFLTYSRGDTVILVLDRPAPDPTTITTPYTPQLNLNVYRRPLVAMVDPANDSPEISADKHMDLIYWMLYLAYNTRDSDAGDSDRAQTAGEQFTAAFGEKIDANVKRKQLAHGPPVCRAEGTHHYRHCSRYGRHIVEW